MERVKGWRKIVQMINAFKTLDAVASSERQDRARQGRSYRLLGLPPPRAVRNSTSVTKKHHLDGKKPLSTKFSHGSRLGIMLSLNKRRIISAMPGLSMAPSRRNDLFSGIMNL